MASIQKLCILYIVGFVFGAPRGITKTVFAGFTLDYEDLLIDISDAWSNNMLYFAYYDNTAMNNGSWEHVGDNFGNSFKILDNIPPGLSILTYPKRNSTIMTQSPVARHISSHLEGWCYLLILCVVYPKVALGAINQHITLAKEFYNYCLAMSRRSEDRDYTLHVSSLGESSKLISEEDAYLLEKWSQMCPSPLYLSESIVANMARVCKSIKEDHGAQLIHNFTAKRYCYMNDIITNDWIPYSRLFRDSLTSIGISLDCIHAGEPFADKWSYVHMPKRAELELSMKTLLLSLSMTLLSKGNQRAANAYKLLKSDEVLDLDLNFATGSAQTFSDEHDTPSQKLKLSFGVSFRVASDIAEKVEGLFDFCSWDKGSVEILNSSLISAVYSTVETKYAHKLSYERITGLGQHRNVDLSISIDVGALKQYPVIGDTYYFRIVHMLDTGVFLDNDELNNYFALIADEDELYSVKPSQILVDSCGNALVNLNTLRTPFISIEDPEIQSSPIIYSGYVSVNKAVLGYAALKINYNLPIHARYMHMSKALKNVPSVLGNDKKILEAKHHPRYSLVMISEPQLYILTDAQNELPTHKIGQDMEKYLEFLRSISFTKFASDLYNVDGSASGNVWRRIYFTIHDHSGIPAEICNVGRTGLAFPTNIFSRESCFHLSKTNRRPVTDSHIYLVFSVPVGNHDDSTLALYTTIAVTAASSIMSMIVTWVYCAKLAKTMRKTKNSTKSM